MRINANSPEELVSARAKYYDQLAEHFLNQIGPRRFRTILEAGCGKGQLTIPLLRRLPRHVEMTAVDSSRGPYSGWVDELGKTLRKTEFEKRVRLIRSDTQRVNGGAEQSVSLLSS